MLTPRRIVSSELLDAADAPRQDVDRSLHDLRWINRFWGGISIYRRLVKRFSPQSIIDVGTGTADLIESVRTVSLRVGLDFKIDHLSFLRHGSHVHRVVGDARQLPFRANAVDLVTSSHFFHHFSPAENDAILQEALRVTRRAVAVTDTRRHLVPLVMVHLLGALGLFGRITRLDAPASVRQGYTVAEAQAIAATAGAKSHQVIRAWPYRFAILLWKG